MNTRNVPGFVLLTLITVGHVLRVLFGVELSVAGVDVPVWMSIPIVIVFGLAAYLIWSGSRSAVQ